MPSPACLRPALLGLPFLVAAALPLPAAAQAELNVPMIAGRCAGIYGAMSDRLKTSHPLKSEEALIMAQDFSTLANEMARKGNIPDTAIRGARKEGRRLVEKDAGGQSGRFPQLESTCLQVHAAGVEAGLVAEVGIAN